jgi:hypothetical protein
LDCRDNVGIGAAPTDIAAHQLADFVGRVRLAFGDQADGGTDLARSAVAALEGVILDARVRRRNAGV